MNKTSNVIEQYAVNYLQDTINTVPCLSCTFNKGEKGISWDGSIYIHKDERQTKENVKNILVQIKGRSTSKKFNKNISYQVEISDLQNYKEIGGTMFFVVEIIEGERKIYCIDLLPINIESILKKKKNNKKVSLHLKEFPTEINEIEARIRNFYENYKIQKNSTVLTIKEAYDNKLKITQRVFVPTGKDPLQYMINNETQLFAECKISNKNVIMPIDTNGLHQIIEKTINRKVLVNNKLYFNKYKVVYEKDNQYIKLNENIIMTFDGSTISIEYKNLNTIKSIFNSIEFIINLFKYGRFCIGDIEITINKDNVDEIVSKLENNLLLARELKDILNFYEIDDENIRLDKLTNEDLYVIKVLHKTLIKKEYYESTKIKNNITMANISNYSFIIYMENIDVNRYKLFDFIKMNRTFKFDIDNNIYDVSKYHILPYEVIFKASNFNLKEALSSIRKYANNQINYELCNEFMLFLINLFDETKNRKYLEEAHKLFNFLHNKTDYSYTKEYEIINKYQIIKRKRKLYEKEMSELKSLLKSTKNLEALYGINILLGNYEKARKIYNKFNDDSKEAYSKYPITYLLNNHDH